MTPCTVPSGPTSPTITCVLVRGPISTISFFHGMGCTIMPCTRPPPHKCKETNASKNGHCVIHIEDCDGLNRREEEDDGEERGPRAGPDVDIPGCTSKVDWSGCEILRPDDLLSEKSMRDVPCRGWGCNNSNQAQWRRSNYQTSIHGSGTLKIAEMAVYDARSIKPRQAQKKALTHTEMIGVCVLELIL